MKVRGYNTSFHMALDKFYGSSSKLKEMIDVCHQNGAVILDVAESCIWKKPDGKNVDE
jgi:1,4-alpha-glucan branching enzyme